MPTEIAWKLPEGAKADPIVWPTPTLFDIGGVINYGFKDEAMLLVRITPPANLSGPLTLAAEANWLVCEDVCIPEEGKFELVLPSGAARDCHSPATTHLVRAGASRRCRPQSPWPARYGLVQDAAIPPCWSRPRA